MHILASFLDSFLSKCHTYGGTGANWKAQVHPEMVVNIHLKLLEEKWECRHLPIFRKKEKKRKSPNLKMFATNSKLKSCFSEEFYNMAHLYRPCP